MPEFVSAPVQYGHRVKTLIVYLTNQQFIPEDRLQQAMSDLFSLQVATSTIAKINDDFAQKISSLQEQNLEKLKKSEVKGVDESGLRIAGKTQWLHTVVSDKFTHYRIAEKRGDLLEGVQGIIVHDHWKPYFTMTGVMHALCNAHHLRELEALKSIEKEPWAFSMSRLLRLFCRLKNAPFERVSLLYDTIVQKGFGYHQSLQKLSGRKRRPGHNLLLRFQNFKDAVLRFLAVPGVPFTNNQAEQDIRMIKVKQKISGGFRTIKGAETFCTIRGFISTLRKQNLPIFQTILANT
jgi:transposase